MFLNPYLALLCLPWIIKGAAAATFQPRIVGGQKAAEGEFPWMAHLNGRLDCGATLIGDEWILTAAHCVVDEDGKSIPVENLELAVGAFRLDQSSIFQQVEQVIIHPGFDNHTMENDIALLRLETPLGENVQPIQWNSDPRIPAPYAEAVVIGWGSLLPGGDNTDILHKVTLPVVSQERANDPKAYDGSILPSMLAAGLVQGGKDSCQGDSGGPLILDVNGKWLQVGIVSWGKGCGEPYAYGIHTRLSSFANWIEGITGLVGEIPIPEPKPLQILSQPKPVTLSLNDYTEFRVEAIGEEPITYQWFLNGVPLPGAQNAIYAIEQVGLEDAGDYSVTIANEETTLLSHLATLVLLEKIDLAEAVDQPTWAFSDAEAPFSWIGQREISLDRADAAQSQRIEDGQKAIFSTEVVGPGSLYFFWKVSSEPHWDRLEFWVDDKIMGAISGEQAWEMFHLLLPEGTHLLRWIYQKDDWLSKGEDSAWVDRISFSLKPELQIILQPISMTASTGDSVTFEAWAVGKPPLTYQWYYNQRPISEASSRELNISSVGPEHIGNYHVQISSIEGSVMSQNAILDLLNPDSANQPPGSDPSDRETLKVSGLVSFQGNKGPVSLSGVIVSLLQDGQRYNTISDAQGAFSFNAMTVAPAALYPSLAYEGEEAKMGVDISDLIRIRNHIDQRELFDQDIQRLAADVNRDGAIDSEDLLSVRGVILGKTKGFSLNSSGETDSFWRFVSKELTQDALSLIESQGIEVDVGQTHLPDMVLTAIRLGDVTGDWATWSHVSSEYPEIDDTTTEIVQLERSVHPQTGWLEIDLWAKGRESLLGIQTSVHWDPGILTLVEVNGSHLNGFTHQIHLHQQRHNLSIAWDAPYRQGVSLGEKKTLLNLKFAPLEGAPHGTAIHLSQPLLIWSNRRSLLPESVIYYHPNGLPVISHEGPIRYLIADADQITLEYETEAAQPYQLEWTHKLLEPDWRVISEIQGNGLIQRSSHLILSGGDAFYRLRPVDPALP